MKAWQFHTDITKKYGKVIRVWGWLGIVKIIFAAVLARDSEYLYELLTGHPAVHQRHQGTVQHPDQGSVCVRREPYVYKVRRHKIVLTTLFAVDLTCCASSRSSRLFFGKGLTGTLGEHHRRQVSYVDDFLYYSRPYILSTS